MERVHKAAAEVTVAVVAVAEAKVQNRKKVDKRKSPNSIKGKDREVDQEANLNRL